MITAYAHRDGGRAQGYNGIRSISTRRLDSRPNSVSLLALAVFAGAKALQQLRAGMQADFQSHFLALWLLCDPPLLIFFKERIVDLMPLADVDSPFVQRWKLFFHAKALTGDCCF